MSQGLYQAGAERKTREKRQLGGALGTPRGGVGRRPPGSGPGPGLPPPAAGGGALWKAQGQGAGPKRKKLWVCRMHQEP